MITIKRYGEKDAAIWNQFNRESKTSLFMFDRNYMDYHKDRFTDHSLLFFDEKDLISILPLTEQGDELISHGGLTYGGFLTNDKMKQHTMNDCFSALIDYSQKKGIKRIRYKQIPYIFYRQPAEEDRYALFINNAKIERIEASTVINLQNPLKMPKGRKAQISRAKREGVEIAELFEVTDYCSFIQLENNVLSEYHDTKAVHTGEELALLHSRFPENIHLFGAASKEGYLIAGAVVFEYDSVIHTQYMAANAVAREIGALDLTIKYVMDKYQETKKWLDFGISTEDGGRYLNHGLIAQKEGFGGRTVVYQTWVIDNCGKKAYERFLKQAIL